MCNVYQSGVGTHPEETCDLFRSAPIDHFFPEDMCTIVVKEHILRKPATYSGPIDHVFPEDTKLRGWCSFRCWASLLYLNMSQALRINHYFLLVTII